MTELSEDILMATFTGMGRNYNDLVYFDKQKMDVCFYINGYFSSMLSNQTETNKILARRISIQDEPDYIDENRYILIDRLLISEFLEEYKNQTKGKEPFHSFTKLFKEEVQRDFLLNDQITINELIFDNNFQQKFHEVFSANYHQRAQELKEDYSKIFGNTCDELSKKWINNKILKTIDMTENELCTKIVENLKSQIENEFNTKVFECGFYSKNILEFEEFRPMAAVPPENAEHIFYFLVPLDDVDNIITNDYFQLHQEAQKGLPFSPSTRRATYAFQEILREDIELVSFLSSAIDNHVYPTGSKRVSKYRPNDNIVRDAEKIKDLRYRFFRFYLPKMT